MFNYLNNFVTTGRPQALLRGALLSAALLVGLTSTSALAQTEATEETSITAEHNEVIQQCIQKKLHFAYRQDNLTAHYEVTINDELKASDASITHPSGERAFDQAVIKALMDCPTYPEALRNTTFKGVFNFSR